MSTEVVHGTVEDGVGTITLNRPERRNALSPEMLVELSRLLLTMETDVRVRALVLTGAGNAFCSGGDVQQFDDQGGEGLGSDEVDPEAVRRQQREQRDIVGRIYRFAKPTVAVLPGPAAGAGMGLALATDFRVGSERTLMATAFGAVGLSGDYGVTWLLAQAVGPAEARRLLYLGDRVDAHECLRLGLINWLVAEDELREYGASLARRLASGPRLALAHMKQNLLRAPNEDLEDAMDAEVALHKACGVTTDHVEAVRAFVEKRKPVFTQSSET